MRFNGVELCSVHPALSINTEIYPGMPRREVLSTRGNSGEVLAGYQEERAEAEIRVNIAAKSKSEAYDVRALLAAWAASSGEATGKLEPTHWTGRAYDAILSNISEPEFVRGFTTVDVTFVLPRPYAYSVHERSAGGKGKAAFTVGGTARVRPTIAQTMAAAAKGLTWSMDGKAFMRLADDYTVPAGAVVAADFTTGALTINGAHEERRIDYTASTWQPAMRPGSHVLSSTDAGEIKARWHDEWI